MQRAGRVVATRGALRGCALEDALERAVELDEARGPAHARGDLAAPVGALAAPVDEDHRPRGPLGPELPQLARAGDRDVRLGAARRRARGGRRPRSGSRGARGPPARGVRTRGAARAARPRAPRDGGPWRGVSPDGERDFEPAGPGLQRRARCDTLRPSPGARTPPMEWNIADLFEAAVDAVPERTALVAGPKRRTLRRARAARQPPRAPPRGARVSAAATTSASTPSTAPSSSRGCSPASSCARCRST